MEILVVCILVALVAWRVWRNRTGAGSTPRQRGSSVLTAAPPTPHRTRPAIDIGQIVRDQRQEVDREADRMMRELDAAVEREYGASGAPLPRSQTTGDHRPPPPSLELIEAWSSETRQLEVAGEYYRADNLCALFRRHGNVSASGSELSLPAVLVPDPQNPYDPHAVAVYADGLHVGYMERGDAQRYHRALAALQPSQLTVRSRQWVRATAKDTWARVTLSLPVPDCLTCPNGPPEGAAMIPAGSAIQVTREDEHLEVLTGLLARYGTEAVVAATLRPSVEVRPRSTLEVVEVCIDGEVVGILSSTQGANLMPIVLKAQEFGREAACRAKIRGNSLKVDVALYARKAHELTQEELDEVFGLRA